MLLYSMQPMQGDVQTQYIPKQQQASSFVEGILGFTHADQGIQ